VVVHAPQVVVVERRERPVQRQDLEPVAAEVEVADDLRPEQGDDVGRDAEPEAGDDLLGDGGPAEHLAALEDNDAHAGPREVRGGDQAVVAAPDDDGVVALLGRHRAQAYGG
jgi:hypothetical protein